MISNKFRRDSNKFSAVSLYRILMSFFKSRAFCTHDLFEK